MRQIDLIMDLQYGSTGKGLLAGALATYRSYDTVMTAWGPNAGHTFIDGRGRKFVHIMLANGVVGDTVKRIMVGPGSILDLDILLREISACGDIIDRNNISIYVHPHAGVVTDEDRAEESVKMTAIGSTKKGVGAALSSKIARQPLRPTVAKDFADHPVFREHDEWPVILLPSPQAWAEVYGQSSRVLVEGAQGFGLSIQHGHYPYTTSRDVTPNQILADCGVPFKDVRSVCVYGTVRTFPIRVSNRKDDHGNMVGWSGPHYADQREMEWSELGLEAELTTVTKLPRRLFSYSREQMEFANEMCSPDVIFLNFVNYLKSEEEFTAINDHLTKKLGVGEVIYGIGAGIDDVVMGLWGSSAKRWNELCEIMNGRAIDAAA